jgi:hypothetical protein
MGTTQSIEHEQVAFFFLREDEHAVQNLNLLPQTNQATPNLLQLLYREESFPQQNRDFIFRSRNSGKKNLPAEHRALLKQQVKMLEGLQPVQGGSIFYSKAMTRGKGVTGGTYREAEVPGSGYCRRRRPWLGHGGRTPSAGSQGSRAEQRVEGTGGRSEWFVSARRARGRARKRPLQKQNVGGVGLGDETLSTPSYGEWARFGCKSPQCGQMLRWRPSSSENCIVSLQRMHANYQTLPVVWSTVCRANWSLFLPESPGPSHLLITIGIVT